jgi:transposase
MHKIPAIENRMTVGSATVAMVLNGLGWSLRQLDVVPQFFAGHPRRTLGFDQGSLPRFESADCLGRTPDWLYTHDPTQLFDGIASRARHIFGIKAEQVHVDTTSFSVSGAYAQARAKQPGEEESAVPEAALGA